MTKVQFQPVWNARTRGRRRPNAPSILEEVWLAHRSNIATLYLQRDMRLEDVMDHMRDMYGFTASKRQYTKKLKDWGYRKYNLSSYGEEAAAATSQLPDSQERVGTLKLSTTADVQSYTSQPSALGSSESLSFTPYHGVPGILPYPCLYFVNEDGKIANEQIVQDAKSLARDTVFNHGRDAQQGLASRRLDVLDPQHQQAPRLGFLADNAPSTYRFQTFAPETSGEVAASSQVPWGLASYESHRTEASPATALSPEPPDYMFLEEPQTLIRSRDLRASTTEPQNTVLHAVTNPYPSDAILYSKEMWEIHRPMIDRMCRVEDRSIRQVRKALREIGFNVTKCMIRNQIWEWGISLKEQKHSWDEVKLKILELYGREESTEVGIIDIIGKDGPFKPWSKWTSRLPQPPRQLAHETSETRVLGQVEANVG